MLHCGAHYFREKGAGLELLVMASDLEDLKTDHLYYADTALFTCEAKVLRQEELEAARDGRQISLILDRTVMHPQGGNSSLINT